MKSAGARQDFMSDKVSLFDQEINLEFTSSGHYMISLLPKSQAVLINVTEQSQAEKIRMARKLHLQFGQGDSKRINKLVKDSATEDEELSNALKKDENECEICPRYKKPKLEPAVGFSLAKDFNEVVSMDLQKLSCSNHQFLHMIDNATRYSAAFLIKSKEKSVIVDSIFRQWVAFLDVLGRF